TVHRDDLDRGKAELATNTISVWENGGPVTITIHHPRPSTNPPPRQFASPLTPPGTPANPLPVQFAPAEGTGVGGSCYQAVSGSVTFAPGETTKTIQVPVIDNDHWDPGTYKYFSLSLSGKNLGAVTTEYIYVFNDDPNRG